MMENKKNLEKRMYFLVPYNISPIQQAIQAGHAALEYAHTYSDDPEYVNFIKYWKTWIILNGGTTNNRYETIGLTGIVKSILDYNDENPDNTIKYTTFNEPDLNDALTAICLVVDERVFNREEYPDFFEWCRKNNMDNLEKIDPKMEGTRAQEAYSLYKNEVGEKIVFLKELLNTKKLA